MSCTVYCRIAQTNLLQEKERVGGDWLINDCLQMQILVRFGLCSQFSASCLDGSAGHPDDEQTVERARRIAFRLA